MALGLWDDAHALLARRYPATGVVAEPGSVLPQDYPLVAYYRGYCAEKMGRSGRDDFALASRQSTRYVFPNRPESLVVLRRAVEIEPEDATAHFLLGSLQLSGGRTEEALAEWAKARALDPRLPVLHRNIGFTLLYARADAEEALRAFEEGMGADPTNVELYQGADQALSLLARGPDERIAALRRYPETPLPSTLVYKLALALAEAGRFAEAEALFPGRFFPREEFGTNVRQVYLEVKLRQAFALAREGRKAEASALAASFGQPVPGFDFTKDGMAAFVGAPRFQYYSGELQALLGNDAAAREHWKRAAAGRDLPADGVRLQGGAAPRRGERPGVASAARDGARRGRALPLPRRPLPRRRHLRPGHAAARPGPHGRGRRGPAPGVRAARQGHAAPHRAPGAPGAAIEGGEPRYRMADPGPDDSCRGSATRPTRRRRRGRRRRTPGPPRPGDAAMRDVRVAAAQMESLAGDKEANCRKLAGFAAVRRRGASRSSPANPSRNGEERLLRVREESS